MAKLDFKKIENKVVGYRISDKTSITGGSNDPFDDDYPKVPSFVKLEQLTFGNANERYFLLGNSGSYQEAYNHLIKRYSSDKGFVRTNDTAPLWNCLVDALQREIILNSMGLIKKVYLD
ncbi:MAG: hypothetical protein WC867_02875 [Candidatus Pacearchaeota archaeon]|jgi:hypothetical protein